MIKAMIIEEMIMKEMIMIILVIFIIQGDFFNWASPENVSGLAPL